MTSDSRQKLLRRSRIVLGVAAFCFLGLTFAESARTAGPLLPSWQRILAAEVFCLAALFFGARGWASILDTEPTLRLASGFLGSQIAKYLPGVVWQPAEQVASARRAGIPLGKASAALAVNMLVYVAAGATVAAGVALNPQVPGALRVAALPALGVVLAALLRRRWMIPALRAAGRLTGRNFGTDLIPSQRCIIRSYLWSIGSLIASGISFWVLLELDRSPAVVVSSFSLAWTAGFVAVFLPTGIGVREGVLIATLGADSAAVIIAASAAHRLLTIAGELVAVIAGRIADRRDAGRVLETQR